MPDYAPNPAASPLPKVRTLEPGAVIWRVHNRLFAPATFNPTIPPPHGGGRFDCTTGAWAYLYAGVDTIAAVSETLLRDRPKASTPYIVPSVKLRERNLSALEVHAALQIVVLHGAGLTALGQDNWLTSCGPADYPKTRAWAAYVRQWAPHASGMEWRARHDDDRLAYILFEDRCPPGAVVSVPHKSMPIDVPGRGFFHVRRACAHHNALVTLPA